MQEYCSNLTVNGKIFSFYDLEKAAKSYDVKVEDLIAFEYYLKVSSEKKMALMLRNLTFLI